MIDEAVGEAKPEPLEHRAAKVSLVNGLSTLLGMASQLVSVPVCLHYWGKETYGSWLALLSAFMLLRSLDGGYVSFVGNKLNQFYHRNTGALREHLASAVFGILCIGLVQLAFVVAVLLSDPMAALLGVSGDRSAGLSAKLGLLMLMTSWVLTGSYLGLVHRLLIPAGLMYQAAWWAMEFQLCQFGAIMIAALFRMTMLQTSLVFSVSQVVSYVASAWYVRRKLPQFSPWLIGAKRKIGLGDLLHSLTLTASNLIQQGSINGSVLLVAGLAGPSAVPVFTTARTLTNLWTTVTTILSAPLLPDVVRLHAQGDILKLVSINRAYWALVGNAVCLGVVLTYPLIPFLYGHWTGYGVALDRPLLSFLLASVVVANAGALISLYLGGINSVGIVLRACVARALIGLVGGALMFRFCGLASFGMFVFAGEVVATLMSIRFFATGHLKPLGVQMPLSDGGPILLSAGSACIYLIGAGMGWWKVGWIWSLAVVGVLISSAWGWVRLDAPLRIRLKAVPVKLLRL